MFYQNCNHQLSLKILQELLMACKVNYNLNKNNNII